MATELELFLHPNCPHSQTIARYLRSGVTSTSSIRVISLATTPLHQIPYVIHSVPCAVVNRAEQYVGKDAFDIVRSLCVAPPSVEVPRREQIRASGGRASPSPEQLHAMGKRPAQPTQPQTPGLTTFEFAKQGELQFADVSGQGVAERFPSFTNLRDGFSGSDGGGGGPSAAAAAAPSDDPIKRLIQQRASEVPQFQRRT
jgi:hypothetical protein